MVHHTSKRKRFWSIVAIACTVVLAVTAIRVVLTPADDEVALTLISPEWQEFFISTGLDVPQRLVIRESQLWEEVWAEMWRHRTSPPTLPEVDFREEVILLAALGWRPTTGSDSIHFEGGSQVGDYIEVRVVATLGCGMFPSFSAPVAIARLNRTEQSVRFVEREVTRECGS